MNFFTLLGLLFIGLKLAGLIDWSWLLVTVPLWGGFVLFLVLCGFLACFRIKIGRMR